MKCKGGQSKESVGKSQDWQVTSSVLFFILYSWIKTIYSINRRKNNGSGLESYREGDVELAACQVVRHGVLQVVDVGDPVAAAHVGDVSCWVTSWEFAEHHAYKLTPSVVAPAVLVRFLFTDDFPYVFFTALSFNFGIVCQLLGYVAFTRDQTLWCKRNGKFNDAVNCF